MWVSRLRRHRRSTACTVEADTPRRPAIGTGLSRCFHRQVRDRAHHRRWRPGTGCDAGGRSDRPSRPHRGSGNAAPSVWPSARTPHNAPPLGDGQPSSTTRRARRRRPRGVSVSLGHKGLLLADPLRNRRPSPVTDLQTVSSHNLNHPAWALHLGPVSRFPFVASGVQAASRKAEEGVSLVSAGE
jgi:hypothetical protein